MPTLTAKNFRIAVAVLVVGCLISFVAHTQSMESIRAVYGSFAYRILLAPLVGLLVSIILWLAYYRHGEGHWPAFAVGWTLLFSAIGLYASASINELRYSRLELVVLLYAGVSHVSYGLLEWREILKVLGSDEP